MKKLLSMVLCVALTLAVCCALVPAMSGAADYEEEPMREMFLTGDRYNGHVIYAYYGYDYYYRKCYDIPEEINSFPVVGLSVDDNTEEYLTEMENNLFYIDNWLYREYELREKKYVREGTIGICDYAFCGDREKENTVLQAIVLPDSMKYIGASAFKNCTILKEINLPESVVILGGSAFSNCASLEEIILPEGLKYIGDGAFSNCTKLKSIELPQGLDMLESGAFRGCSELTSVVLPDSITKISGYLFKDCTKLSSVALGDTVTEIYSEAFAGCPIEEIYLPSTIKRIDGNAFSDTAITDIYYAGSEQDWYTKVDTTWNVSNLTVHFNATRPTKAPTTEPTAAPTAEPTVAPTGEPTGEPTATPTGEPTVAPTGSPVTNPTEESNITPTMVPTDNDDSVVVNFPEVEIPDYTSFVLQFPDIELKADTSTVIIPVKVLRCNCNLWGYTGRITYDPSVLSCRGVWSDYFDLYCEEIEPGTLEWGMTSKDYGNGFCSCGVDAFVLCFDVVGDGGSETSISLEPIDPENIIDVDFNMISSYVFPGSVAIQENETTSIVENETTATEDILYGDANDDGVVNMKDVLAIRKYVANLTDSINLATADANADGVVNMKDVLSVRKYIAGLIDTLGA